MTPTIQILGAAFLLFHQYHGMVDEYVLLERRAEGTFYFLVVTAVEIGVIYLIWRLG